MNQVAHPCRAKDCDREIYRWCWVSFVHFRDREPHLLERAKVALCRAHYLRVLEGRPVLLRRRADDSVVEYAVVSIRYYKQIRRTA